MPSRRQVLATFGSTLTIGLVAGCAGSDATAGTVTRKSITVGVPRPEGGTVDASVALLAFEPDRGLLHGEYDPDHVGAAVDGGTLSIPRSVHDRLDDRFASVRYLVNVVPSDGQPAGGVVTREACNALSLGGTATVAQYVDDGVGHLEVRETTTPDTPPNDVTVTQFDLDERLDRE